VPDTPEEWRGSLILGQQDKSGLTYMRNRYYDASTGRFTQVDPIGIAGGLNVYGFAGGDPVNYRDPFGLCPPQDSNFGPLCPGFWSALGGGIGAIIGAAGGGTGGFVGGAALCSPAGPVAIACGAGGAAAGGAAGALKGAAIGASIGALVDGAVQMAQAGKGRGGNEKANRDVRRIAKDNNLNEEGRRALHDEITNQNYKLDEIRDIARDLAKQNKYVNKPPPQ
jgi:RHS repeat-associated protein